VQQQALRRAQAESSNGMLTCWLSITPRHHGCPRLGLSNTESPMSCFNRAPAEVRGDVRRVGVVNSE
jgi:hypothetical protein